MSKLLYYHYEQTGKNKSRNWFFKIIIAVLVAIMAGLSKLYIDNEINLVFYLGAFIAIILSVLPVIIFLKIKKHITELGEL